MQTVQYKLSVNEYAQYLKYCLLQEKGIRLEQISMTASLPLAFVIIGLANHLSWTYAVMFVILTLLWLPCSRYLFMKLLAYAVKNRLDDQKVQFDDATLQFGNGKIVLNGDELLLQNYYIMPELIDLQCSESMNIIVPNRAFNTKDQSMAFIKNAEISIDGKNK